MSEVEVIRDLRKLTAANPIWTVHPGDARQTGTFLAQVAREAGLDDAPFLMATITSPPYANLVDYGTAGQIGFGQSYDEYLDECESIFRDVHEWTRDEGSLWLVADTLMGRAQRGTPASLIPLPFALAERATRAGWILRDVIVWRKDRTRPWASPGRLRNGFEYVLYFVKSGKFKHRVERLRDLRSLKSWWVKYPERHNPWGMTPDNVWDIPIPVQGSWASSELRHACPFPEELVRRMVQLSTDEGDVVFDPFSGSGMVSAVAEADARLPLGTEINEEFRKVYANHVRPTVLRAPRDELDVDATELTGNLITLRVLKYPKELIQQLLRTGLPRADMLVAYVSAESFDLSPRSSDYANVKCVLFVRDSLQDAEIEDVKDRVRRAETRAPLSRYGLNLTTSVRRLSEGLRDEESSEGLSVYLDGRTWVVAEKVNARSFPGVLTKWSPSKLPPIVSPLVTNQVVES